MKGWFKAKRRRRPRLTKNWRRTVKLIWSVLLFSGVAILIYGVWQMTRASSLTISTVEIEAGETIPLSELNEIVSQTLAGAYFTLIPRRFTYTYPETEIINNLTSLPRVKTVTLVKTTPTSLKLSVTEYFPYALWCNRAKPDACVFIDKDGFAFSAAPALSGGSFLRYYLTGQTPDSSRQAFDSAFITVTESFATLIGEAKQFIVKQITLTEAGDIIYGLASGAKLLTNSELDPQQSFDNLLTVLDNEKFVHLTQDDFAYIDLRFGNKVYLQEELPELTTNSTDTAAEAQQ